MTEDLVKPENNGSLSVGERSATSPMDRLPAALRSGLELKQLPGLDGLRAIAAFLVVFYHGGIPASPGGLGVLAFFVLSGFLITWLLLAEQDRYGTISLRLFYARRSLRIFPAFYAYWLMIIAWTAFRHRVFWPQAIASLFFVNNYYQAIFGDPNTGLSHTWSLGVEEQFYLLWPAAFLLLSRFPRPQVVRILLAAIGGLWIYRGILVYVGVHQGYIYEAFDTRADHLLMGCTLAFASCSGSMTRLWRVLCSNVGYSIVILAILILSVVLEHRYGAAYRDTAGFIVDPVTIALLIPLFMYYRAGIVWGWLNWPAVRYLGRISYSLYLYQQITPELVEKILPHAPTPVFVAANSAVVVLVASGSYYVVERPFLKLKDRFAKIHHGPV